MNSHLFAALRKMAGSSSSRGRLPAFRTVIVQTTVIAALCTLLWGFIPGDAWAEPGERISLGSVEEVVLLPWGVRLPARIDTGAATSSLDARELTVKDDIADFKLPVKYGGVHLRLPVLRLKEVKTSATKSRRPVVAIELCIGNRRIQTEVNLNDRSQVKYPLIIGRNTLKHNFIIDCSTSYCTTPSCAEVPPQ